MFGIPYSQENDLKYTIEMRSKLSVEIINDKMRDESMKFIIIVYGANHEKSLNFEFEKLRINHVFLTLERGPQKRFEAPPPT